MGLIARCAGALCGGAAGLVATHATHDPYVGVAVGSMTSETAKTGFEKAEGYLTSRVRHHDEAAKAEPASQQNLSNDASTEVSDTKLNLAGEETQDQTQDHEASLVEEQPEVANTATPEEGEGQDAGTAAQDATEHAENEESQNTAETSDQSQVPEDVSAGESQDEDYGYGY